MPTTHSHFGNSKDHERESRELYRQGRRDTLPNMRDFEQFGSKVKGGIEGFMAAVTGTFRELIGSDEQTKAYMNSEERWVEAFTSVDMDTDTIEPLPRNPFTPSDLLKSKSKQERQQLFIRYLRAIIPANVRADHPDVFPPELFGDDIPDIGREFKDRKDAELRGFFPGIDIGDEQLAILQKTAALLVGDTSIGGPTDERALAIAGETLAEHYSTDLQGWHRLQHDYAEAIRQAKIQQGGEISDNIREDPALLYPLVPAGRFKAALLTQMNGYVPMLRERPSAHIADFALSVPGIDDTVVGIRLLNSQLKLDEQLGRKSLENIEKDLGTAKTEAKERLASAQESFTENLRNMGGLEKFIGAVAVGYALMKSPFFRKISFGVLVGYFGLRGMGYEQPLDVMFKKGKQGVLFAWDKTRDVLEKAKILAPEKDRNYMLAMSRYLIENGFDDREGLGFVALGKATPSSVAEAFSLETGGSNLVFGLTAGKGSAIDIDLRTAIANGDPLLTNELLDRALVEMDTNPKVAEAIGLVYYHLGGKDDPAAFERLESVRKSHPKNAAWYKNLSGPDRVDFRRIVDLGKQRSKKYDSFASIIKFLAEPEETENRENDTAERLAGTPLNMDNRKAELVQATETRTGLKDNEANALMREKLLEKEGIVEKALEESLTTLEEMGIIKATENSGQTIKEIIMEQFDVFIRGKDDSKLREILLGIEIRKYQILSKASSITGPLSRDALGIEQASTIGDVYDSILQFVNQLGATSLFRKVTSLSDVKAMLGERFLGSDVRSLNDEAGFPELAQKLDVYDKLFDVMRGNEILNPKLIAGMAGNETDKRILLRTLLQLDGDKDRIDFMEKYLAQKIANSIAIAMLTEHKRDGKHRFHPGGSSEKPRVITRRESRNIAAELDQYFAEMTGTIVVSPDGNTVAHPQEGFGELWDVLDREYSFASIPDIALVDSEGRIDSNKYKSMDERLRRNGEGWIFEKNWDHPANIAIQERKIIEFGDQLIRHVKALLNTDRRIRKPSYLKSFLENDGYELANLEIRLLRAIGSRIALEMASELEDLITLDLGTLAGQSPGPGTQLAQGPSTTGTAGQGNNPFGGGNAPSGTAGQGNNPFGGGNAPSGTAGQGNNPFGGGNAPSGTAGQGNNPFGGGNAPSGTAGQGNNPFGGGSNAPSGTAGQGNNPFGGGSNAPSGASGQGNNPFDPTTV